MFNFIILPFFLFAVFMGVRSWPWKIILCGVFAASWYYWSPASIAVAVVIIIGIAFKNSLSKISGSKI